MKRSWQLGRKIFEATHKLKVNACERPAGTPVHLLAQRKEKDGWHVLLNSPILNKQSNSYIFVTKWENLERI